MSDAARIESSRPIQAVDRPGSLDGSDLRTGQLALCTQQVALEPLTATRRPGPPSAACAGSSAVLIAGRTEGNAVPGRLAVKTGPGVLTDAVNVTTGPDGVPVAEPPNFGGAITAHSAVKAGTPIVAVRPNAIAANPTPGAAAPEPVAFAASDAAKATTITDYGIVGDLFTVVPQLIEENSKRRGS